jgi:hypothetical protein
MSSPTRFSLAALAIVPLASGPQTSAKRHVTIDDTSGAAKTTTSQQ